MSCNKRMIDIEREINDFFASDKFKKLALSYNGVYPDHCNENKFQIFEDAAIDSICRLVNEKIKEFIDNEAICMFIKGDGIYMESDLPFRRKGWICPTCRWGTNYDKQRCDFCGQRLLPPYKFMEDLTNGDKEI